MKLFYILGIKRPGRIGYIIGNGDPKKLPVFWEVTF